MHEQCVFLHSLILGSIFLLGLASLGKVTEAGQPSVYYINTPIHSNFFVAKDKAIPIENATYVLNGVNNCTCKNECWVRGDYCMAWSLILTGGTTQCRLARLGPEDTHVFDEPQATYFFKESSISGTYELANDGLMYVELEGSSDHETGKARCSSIPGHRLSIAKTLKTFDYLRIKAKPSEPLVVLDVLKPSPLVWGDGTPVADTELNEANHFASADGPEAKYFAFWYRKLNDFENSQFRIICQANPAGIPW